MDIVSYVLLSAVVAVQNRNVLSRSPYEVFGRHSLPDVRRDVKIVLRREAEQDDANTESPTNTSIIRDNHRYYNTEYYESFLGEYPWIDLSSDNKSSRSELSYLSRKAEVYRLKFLFPFYGHYVSTIAVTTGGFLYMSNVSHPFLAETQYVAPLMADFNFNLSSTSAVYYLDTVDDSNGLKKFVVQWDNAVVQDHEQNGTFTFQCILFENGTIVMLYKQIPIAITSISSENHPVTVGVSDALYIDSLQFGFRIRRIYEYHNINVSSKYPLSTGSTLLLQPIPNCISAKSCQECIAIKDFQCSWCGALNRCSDGIDRHRQDWLESRCSETATKSCMEEPTTKSSDFGVSSQTQTVSTSEILTADAVRKANESSSSGLSPGASAGIAVAVVLAIAILLVTLFIVYAYRYPTSKSGLWLIEHRAFWRSWKKSKESTFSETPQD